MPDPDITVDDDGRITVGSGELHRYQLLRIPAGMGGPEFAALLRARLAAPSVPGGLTVEEIGIAVDALLWAATDDRLVDARTAKYRALADRLSAVLEGTR